MAVKSLIVAVGRRVEGHHSQHLSLVLQARQRVAGIALLALVAPMGVGTPFAELANGQELAATVAPLEARRSMHDSYRDKVTRELE